MEVLNPTQIPSLNSHTRLLKTSKSKLTPSVIPNHEDLGVVPIDIARLIMLHLSDVDINKLMRLNKWFAYQGKLFTEVTRWNKITSTDMYFWRLKTELDYGKSAVVDPKGMEWRDVYKDKNLGPWADYVAEVVKVNHLEKMIIIGMDKVIWGRTNMFRLHKGEFDTIIKALDYSRPTSAHIEGKNYILLRADCESVILKSGQSGVCIFKTNKALVIGVCETGTIRGCSCLEQCSNAIGSVAQKLKEQGN